MDEQETKSVGTGTIGPGIAGAIKILFDEEQKDLQKSSLQVDHMAREGTVVIDRVREVERTVMVKRRARKGQAKESGVKMARIDDLFGGSLAQKRKLNCNRTRLSLENNALYR